MLLHQEQGSSHHSPFHLLGDAAKLCEKTFMDNRQVPEAGKPAAMVASAHHLKEAHVFCPRHQCKSCSYSLV